MMGVGQVLSPKRPFCKTRSSHKITWYPFWRPRKAEVEIDGVGRETFNYHLYIHTYIYMYIYIKYIFMYLFLAVLGLCHCI